MIKTEIEIKHIRNIVIQMSDEDVDEFLSELTLIFKNATTMTIGTKRDEVLEIVTKKHTPLNVFPTLYKIWLEVNANE